MYWTDKIQSLHLLICYLLYLCVLQLICVLAYPRFKDQGQEGKLKGDIGFFLPSFFLNVFIYSLGKKQKKFPMFFIPSSFQNTMQCPVTYAPPVS